MRTVQTGQKTAPVISVKNVSKKYRRYTSDRTYTLQEAVVNKARHLLNLNGDPQTTDPQPTGIHASSDYFWALRNIELHIPAGRMVGLVGHNGAGKSTLLRLIGGVGRPDKGTITVQGNVSGLLDLGAGFHPDLTGRENAFISGVIGGLTRRQVQERFDDIVAFAELEEFIDSPLRTYSSGMQLRLGFAVATHIEPDILLIDEVLAVGDRAFQQKCLDRITQFKNEGSTILLVSHEMALVENLCDEVILLNGGELVARGAPSDVLSEYKTSASH